MYGGRRRRTGESVKNTYLVRSLVFVVIFELRARWLGSFAGEKKRKEGWTHEGGRRHGKQQSTKK